ncbi:MAG: hypothetical protein IMW99_08875 [Firmicutes bacterium]|nr:hypothetical protein [Bacillota bacterium]
MSVQQENLKSLLLLTAGPLQLQVDPKQGAYDLYLNEFPLLTGAHLTVGIRSSLSAPSEAGVKAAAWTLQDLHPARLASPERFTWVLKRGRVLPGGDASLLLEFGPAHGLRCVAGFRLWTVPGAARSGAVQVDMLVENAYGQDTIIDWLAPLWATGDEAAPASHAMGNGHLAERWLLQPGLPGREDETVFRAAHNGLAAQGRLLLWAEHQRRLCFLVRFGAGFIQGGTPWVPGQVETSVVNETIHLGAYVPLGYRLFRRGQQLGSASLFLAAGSDPVALLQTGAYLAGRWAGAAAAYTGRQSAAGELLAPGAAEPAAREARREEPTPGPQGGETPRETGAAAFPGGGVPHETPGRAPSLPEILLRCAPSPRALERALGDLQAWLQLGCRVGLEVGPGWERAPGDWACRDPFLAGELLDWAARIEAAGAEPALWVAPLVAARRSPVAREHPEWLLQDGRGRPVTVALPAQLGRFYPGRKYPAPQYAQRLYVLDGTRPEVQEWLTGLFRSWFSAGFRHFCLDLLDVAVESQGQRYQACVNGTPGVLEALAAIRRGAPDALLYSNSFLAGDLADLAGGALSAGPGERWRNGFLARKRHEPSGERALKGFLAAAPFCRDGWRAQIGVLALPPADHGGTSQAPPDGAPQAPAQILARATTFLDGTLCFASLDGRFPLPAWLPQFAGPRPENPGAGSTAPPAYPLEFRPLPAPARRRPALLPVHPRFFARPLWLHPQQRGAESLCLAIACFNERETSLPLALSPRRLAAGAGAGLVSLPDPGGLAESPPGDEPALGRAATLYRLGGGADSTSPVYWPELPLQDNNPWQLGTLPVRGVFWGLLRPALERPQLVAGSLWPFLGLPYCEEIWEPEGAAQGPAASGAPASRSGPAYHLVIRGWKPGRQQGELYVRVPAGWWWLNQGSSGARLVQADATLWTWAVSFQDRFEVVLRFQSERKRRGDHGGLEKAGL